MIDKVNNTINIEKIAPNDSSHEVTVKEQNEMRDSINKMRREDNEPELTEDEWPSATESFINTIYADHAVNKICEEYDKGVVMTEGMVTWY